MSRLAKQVAYGTHSVFMQYFEQVLQYAKEIINKLRIMLIITVYSTIKIREVIWEIYMYTVHGACPINPVNILRHNYFVR